MPDTQSLNKLLAKKQAQPQSSVEKLVQKKQAVKPESLMGKVGDALGTAMDVLSYPQQKIFGAITGDDRADGDRVLEKAGMSQGLARSLGGFALDVVADPVNLIPGGAIAKGLGKAGKAVDAATGIGKVIETAKESKAARAIGEAFQPHYNTGKHVAEDGLSYSDKARLHSSVKQSTKAATETPTAKAAAQAIEDSKRKVFEQAQAKAAQSSDRASKAALRKAEKELNSNLASGAADRALAEENKKFFSQIASDFGSKEAKEGFRQPTVYKELLGDAHFPESIARDLERHAQFTGGTDNAAAEAWRGGMKVWKSWATSLNPAHHPVNMLGNMQNMYLGGVEGHKIPIAYEKARRALKALKAGDVGEIGAENWEHMRKYGVIGDSATFGGELAPTAKLTNNPLSPNFKLAQKAREFGTNVVEEPARIALFMDRIAKGESPEKAALAVKKYLFDYSELTDVERGMRDFVFPFYTFTRKNLPLQIQSMLTDPAKANKLGDVLNFFDTLSPEAAQATQPDYLSKEGFVPAPVVGSEGEPYLMRMALPIQDVNKVSSLGDAGKTVASMLNPVLKIGAELGTGHEVRGGIPINREKGYQNPATIAAALDQLGVDNIPGMESLLGLVDTPQGRKQLDAQAYAMRQIPAGSWLGRTIAPPEQSGGLNPLVNLLMRVLGTTPVQMNQNVQSREAGRRVDEVKSKERLKRLIMDK